MRCLVESDPCHVARDYGAGRFVEVPGIVVGPGTGRGEQAIQQDIDVAHGQAFLFADERQRVVGRGLHVRQMARLKVTLVPGHDPEGVEQEHAAAQLAAPPGDDAPELAARVDDDGRSVEAPALRREQLSAMVAPLPARGGATVMAEPSRDQPISGAPARAPHWPSRMPRRLASLRRKRRPRSCAWPWRSRTRPGAGARLRAGA